MSKQPSKLQPIVNAYVKHYCKKIFPMVIETEIVAYCKKIFDSDVLTLLDDVKLLEILNRTILWTYASSAVLLYDSNKSGFNGEDDYNTAIRYRDTVTLFTTETGESFCVYIYYSWQTIMRSGYEPKSVICYFDRLTREVRFHYADDLRKKISKTFPLKVKDIPIFREKMVQFQIWLLTNYSAYTRYKIVWGDNGHDSDSIF